MIFQIFITLLALSIIFVISGFFMDLPVVSIIGCVFLFGIGVSMMNTEIEVKTGENITNTINANGSVTSQSIIYNYAPYDFGGVGNTTFAWLLTILGVLLGIIFIAASGG